MTGASSGVLPDGYAELLQQANLSYRILQGQEKDQVILNVLRRIDAGDLSPSGEARRDDWEKGWRENLEQFTESRYDLEALIPKFIRPKPLVRLRQEYAETAHPRFEWNFFQIFRRWLFTSWFAEVDSIYEFGCGPGYNFVALHEMYPDKQLYGLDWAQSAVDLVNLLARTHGMKLEGRSFDFFAPDEDLHLEPNSGVLTICALEQTGRRFERFVDYLMQQKPRVVVQMEPAVEWYDPENLVDYLAIRYHRARGYLEGFYPRLVELASQGRIQILHQRRPQFGSLFHEGYSFVAWRPVV